MSFVKNFFHNISKHYAIDYFLDQKRETRLLLLSVLSFVFIIAIHSSNIVLNHLFDYASSYIGTQLHNRTSLAEMDGKLMSAEDFYAYISKMNIDSLSSKQIIDFIKFNDILDVRVYGNNVYEFLTRHTKWLLIYSHDRGWFEYDINSKSHKSKSTPFRFLDEDFFNNVKIINFFDESQKSLTKCLVKSKNGLTITALDQCSIRITKNTVSVAYPNLGIDDHHGLMMLITFDQNTKIEGDDMRMPESNNKTVYVNRSNPVVKIPDGTCFTIQLVHMTKEGNQYGEGDKYMQYNHMQYNPLTAKVYVNNPNF